MKLAHYTHEKKSERWDCVAGMGPTNAVLELTTYSKSQNGIICGGLVCEGLGVTIRGIGCTIGHRPWMGENRRHIKRVEETYLEGV